MDQIEVLVEAGARRVFASALDWPGWSRSGRSESDALAALEAYAPRYRPVAEGAGLVFEPRGVLVVVERLPGSATTDFGAPDAVGSAELDPPGPVAAASMASLLASAWRVLDEVVAASSENLRKGPRGGGRDRSTMVAHVVGAETAYARKLGLTMRGLDWSDSSAVAAVRGAILDTIRSGEPVANPRRSLWPVAYAACRFAWHVLDHAWEMEDRRA